MLERLAEDATSEMATWLLGDSSVALDLDRITRDAGGNPLFVEELVAAQDPARVPHAVRDLMLVRFDALDGDARHFVRTAALIGPRAPRAWLAAATGLDEDRVHSASRAVLDAGLLLGDDDGRGYLFRHALLRQAILDDLGPDERVRLHRAIAGALTDHPERAAGVDQAAELAYHWDAAEEPGPALRWAVAAARNAESRYAFGAAADAYERALFWWDAVVDADATANVDHAALLLAAAEAAGLAGHVEHAADLGRAALESATAIDPSRGADAAARVFPLLWTADRTPELFEYASRTFEPSLDVVEPHARAAFLVASVVHLVEHASLSETLDVARRMMEAVEEVDDPSIAARAHAAMATCYELSGEFGRVDEEFEEAARLAESTRAYSLLAMVQYNHAAFCLSTPDLRRGMSRVDSVEELVGRFGLRRFHVAARCLRAQFLLLQGDLEAASAVIASVENEPAEGKDARVLVMVRGLVDLMCGDYSAVLAAFDEVDTTQETVSEFAVMHPMIRADGLAWVGDLEGARPLIDRGLRMAEIYSDCSTHGWLAMVGLRVEADVAAAATTAGDIDAIERAEVRARAIVDAWDAARAQLQTQHPLVLAYARACDAEMARLRGDGVVEAAIAAAAEFDAISMPYYATYFRWRAAEAALAADDRRTGIPLLEQARGMARQHGFAGLDAVVTTLARTYQLRIGPGKTTVDGDEPLSVRELEVLRLMADGKSNPEIGDILSISRRTAAAHVSSVLRKLDVTTRAEAASAAVRGGLV